MTGSIAYLVSEYPAPSHTFIREEINALEQQGWTIHRFAHHSSASRLADPADLNEADQTTVLTNKGMMHLLINSLGTLIRTPGRYVRMLGKALQMARNGERGYSTHFGYILLACELAVHVRNHSIDHLHAHFSFSPSDVALLTSILTDVPFSLTFHATYEYADPTRKLNLDAKVEAATFIVLISDHAYRHLRKRHVHHRHKFRLIRYGLNHSWFSSESAPAPASPRLLCIARMVPQKDPASLVHALAKLKAAGKVCHLDWAGDGELSEPTRALAHELGVLSQIEFHGWCSQHEIRSLLSGCSATILTSVSEGIPIAILESFAAGRPVIATDVGGVSEIVEAGINGWLTKPSDPSSLIEALELFLLCDYQDLTAMGRNARKLVERYTIEDTARALAVEFATSISETGVSSA